MNLLIFFVFLISLPLFADQGLTPINQKLNCIGVGKTTFVKLKLKIDERGLVSGSYSGYQAKEGKYLKLSEYNPRYATFFLEKEPVAKLASDGRIQIDFRFSDYQKVAQDHFSFLINRKNGKTTMHYRKKTPESLGKWIKAPFEYYQCEAVRSSLLN